MVSPPLSKCILLHLLAKIILIIEFVLFSKCFYYFIIYYYIIFFFTILFFSTL
ncbi:unnamed protein product [Staurois parvus]|uniref:Uncharacterized protein n=1 Tax=Staurois parvus TaxID=386267 RepID=A0ABN9GST9_9NEOB|nr:unnamed protein product [Staurois parvus]